MGLLSSVGDFLLPGGPHGGKTDPASIFGSPKSVLLGKAPSIDQRSLDLLDPAQRELLLQLTEFLGQPIEDAGALGGTQQTSLEALEQLALGAVSGEGAIGSAGGALEGILGRGPTDIDEFFDTTIRDPLIEDFNEILLPNIGKRFAGQFFGGERQEAERRGFEDLLGTLARERSRVSLEGRRQDDQSTISAAGAATDQSQGLLALLSTLFTAGGVEGGQQNERIQQILQALGLSTKENVVTVDPGSSGLLSSFLGGGGGGAIGGAIAGMFSSEDFKVDKRAAEDVLPLLDEMRIERWKYDERFEDEAEHIGPYAEEFQQAFGTSDSQTIPVIDALGVALKGVQELSGKVSALEAVLMEA